MIFNIFVLVYFEIRNIGINLEPTPITNNKTNQLIQYVHVRKDIQ